MSSGPADQARLDAMLSITLIQTLLSGAYTAVFLQTFPRLRTNRHIISTMALVILYASAIVHLIANWLPLGVIFVFHNDTQNAIMQESFSLITQFRTVTFIGSMASFIAIWLGDILLLWRCYILWTHNKILLCIFTILILGEFVVTILLTSLVLDKQANVVVGALMFMSFGTTVVATSMIIYPIRHFSTDICAELTKFNFTIEVLVESGALYAVTQFVNCILLVTRGPTSATDQWQFTSFWVGIVTPMAGIAPTLIALRISRGTTWATVDNSQNLSSLRFSRPLPLMITSSSGIDTS